MEEILQELKLINQKLNSLQTQCDAHAKEIQENRDLINQSGKRVDFIDKREEENRQSLAGNSNNGYQKEHLPNSSTHIQQGDEIILNELGKGGDKSTGIFSLLPKCMIIIN